MSSRHRSQPVERAPDGAPLQDLIRIGSRGSRLALVQAEWVRDRVAERHPHLSVEIEIINTKGDKLLDAPLAKIGDKGLFTKELETALLDGRIDVAVHSAKDMPTAVPDGLEIIAFTEREDVRDVFVANPALRARRGDGASASTTCRRARAWAARACGAARSSWRCGPTSTWWTSAATWRRGCASWWKRRWRGRSWRRRGSRVSGARTSSRFAFDFDQMLPAVGQGALAIEARADHPRLSELRAALDHPPTALAVSAERALLGTLEGGCQVPIAAHALWAAGGEAAPAHSRSPPTSARWTARAAVRGERARSATTREGLGTSLAAELLERGAGEILDEIRTL